MRVFLTGFMGAGKSTIGRELAALFGWPFVDLDVEIETRAGTSVAEIFKARGEEAFRALEHEALTVALRHSNAVIATGGGTVTFERNRQLMRNAGTSVWLDLPFRDILDRLSPGGRRRRPLFDDEDQALSLFEQRRSAYAEADLRLVLDAGETPARTASRIAARLGGDRCAT